MINLFEDQEIYLGIVGSREIKDLNLVYIAFGQSPWCNTAINKKLIQIISGGARGADTLAEKFAKELGINFLPFDADWDNINVPGALVRYRNGKPYNVRAGFDRNQKLVDYLASKPNNSGKLIALLSKDHKCNGTKDTIRRAKELEIQTFIKTF